MIKLRNVCFSYDKEIFKNINLDIPKNKVTFIIGSNGAGKSTLANIIGGLVFPSSGETYIDDILVNKKTDNKLIRKKVGMVFQNPTNQILFTKVYDDIKFTLENMMTEKEMRPYIKGAEQQGYRKGFKEGSEQGKAEVAKSLLSLGLPTDQIKIATGLSSEQIEALR